MVKSYRGKDVDMQKIFIKNEKSVAVGNVQRNARGDHLGKGGQVIKTVEELTKEYYEANPTAETDVSLKSNPVIPKEEVIVKPKPNRQKKAEVKEENIFEDSKEEEE